MKTEAISKLAMKALAYAFIALGTLACTQEQEAPVPTPDPAPGVGEAPFTPQRTEAQAKHLALAFLREQGGELRALSSTLAFETSVMTRSTARSLSQAVDSLDSASHPVDTLLYVLNLRNDRGCVLVSGDKRLPDIVAYLPQGHLDLKALPKHSGVSLFLESYPKYYGAKLQKVAPPKPDPRDYYSRPISSMKCKREEFRDVLRTGEWVDACPILCPVMWGQNEPYNFRAPFVSVSDQAIAGCTAVAMAQLMASHKYPQSPMGKYIQWDLLCRYPKAKLLYKHEKNVDSVLAYVDQVSYLLRITGNLLGNQWGKNSTGAYTWNIPNLLKSLGYTQTSEESPYSLAGIISSLDKGASVIMSGANQRTAHAWLCDGYKKRTLLVRRGYHELCREVFYRGGKEIEPPIWVRAEHSERIVYEPDREETEYLLHYNWGWDGDLDGYFMAGVFEPGNGRSYGIDVRNILSAKP